MSKVVSGMLKQEINGVVYETLLCPYMVGDVFITTNNINPATRYKGTVWQKIEAETFLMSASENYPVKSTGGENEHILTEEEMPDHFHTTTINRDDGGGNQNWGGLSGYAKVSGVTLGQAGSSHAGNSQPHNNMPKFFAVNMWLRVE